MYLNLNKEPLKSYLYAVFLAAFKLRGIHLKNFFSDFRAYRLPLPLLTRNSVDGQPLDPELSMVVRLRKDRVLTPQQSIDEIINAFAIEIRAINSFGSGNEADVYKIIALCHYDWNPDIGDWEWNSKPKDDAVYLPATADSPAKLKPGKIEKRFKENSEIKNSISCRAEVLALCREVTFNKKNVYMVKAWPFPLPAEFALPKLDKSISLLFPYAPGQELYDLMDEIAWNWILGLFRRVLNKPENQACDLLWTQDLESGGKIFSPLAEELYIQFTAEIEELYDQGHHIYDLKIDHILIHHKKLAHKKPDAPITREYYDIAYKCPVTLLARHEKLQAIELKIRFIQQFAEILLAWHEKDIIHCDIKLENIRVHIGMLAQGIKAATSLVDLTMIRKRGYNDPDEEVFGTFVYQPLEVYLPIKLQPQGVQPTRDYYSFAMVFMEVFLGVVAVDKIINGRYAYVEKIKLFYSRHSLDRSPSFDARDQELVDYINNINFALLAKLRADFGHFIPSKIIDYLKFCLIQDLKIFTQNYLNQNFNSSQDNEDDEYFSIAEDKIRPPHQATIKFKELINSAEFQNWESLLEQANLQQLCRKPSELPTVTVIISSSQLEPEAQVIAEEKAALNPASDAVNHPDFSNSAQDESSASSAHVAEKSNNNFEEQVSSQAKSNNVGSAVNSNANENKNDKPASPVYSPSLAKNSISSCKSLPDNLHLSQRSIKAASSFSLRAKPADEIKPWSHKNRWLYLLKYSTLSVGGISFTSVVVGASLLGAGMLLTPAIAIGIAMAVLGSAIALMTAALCALVDVAIVSPLIAKANINRPGKSG